MKTLVLIDGGMFRPKQIVRMLEQKGTKPTNPNPRFSWCKINKWLSSRFENIISTHYFDINTDKNASSFYTYLESELRIVLHLSEAKTRTKYCQQCNKPLQYNERTVAVEMSIYAIKTALYHDNIVLITGDGDLTPLVQYLRNDISRKVSILSWSESVAISLSKAASEFIRLDEFASDFVSDET